MQFVFIILYFEMFYSKAHFKYPFSSIRSPTYRKCPQKVTHFLPVELLLYKSQLFSQDFTVSSFIAVFVVNSIVCDMYDNNNAQGLKAKMTSYSVVSKRKLYNISCQYAVKGKVFILLQSTPCPCHLPLIVGFANRFRVSGPWSTILCTPKPYPTLPLGYFKSVVGKFQCI